MRGLRLLVRAMHPQVGITADAMTVLNDMTTSLLVRLLELVKSLQSHEEVDDEDEREFPPLEQSFPPQLAMLDSNYSLPDINIKPPAFPAGNSKELKFARFPLVTVTDESSPLRLGCEGAGERAATGLHITLAYRVEEEADDVENGLLGFEPTSPVPYVDSRSIQSAVRLLAGTGRASEARRE